MIPTIEDIVAGLIAKEISGKQALAWLEEHLSLARLYAPLSPPDTPEQIEQRAAQERQDLRDHFAGFSLGGLIFVGHPIPTLTRDDIAKEAYLQADSMLAARVA